MASPRAILAANKAVPGAAARTPAPQGAYPSIGMLNQAFSEPGSGYARAYGPPFLPRPPQTFTEGAFGPFSPILPVPIDRPPPGADRPQPRRWQYRVGYDLPVGEPGSEGYKLASFGTLKALSDYYSIARTCIEIRKNEIRALDWDIVLTPDAAKAYRGKPSLMKDFGERQTKLKKFFSKPDPNYFSFSSWLYAALEQVFVYDTLSLYMCPTRGGGRGTGVLGSGLDSLWLIDGSSVRPLVGLHGEVPQPPAVAFEQYIFGVPRSDYMTMIDRSDLQDAGLTSSDLTGEWRGDQLLYLPYVPRADSPYGFSMVEQCIIPIMTGLRKQAYQLSFFDENSIPGVYISPGDVSMTPNQVKELQLALNAIAGQNAAWNFKVIVLPPGSKTMPQKQMEIVDQADEWIATEVAMVFNINPMEIGVLPKISTVASPFAAREMAQAQRSIHERTSTKPTLKFMTEIANLIIQKVLGQEDCRWLFSGMEEDADLAAQTDMGIKQIQTGALSIDEFRDATGRVPWGLPETTEPIIVTQNGPIPLSVASQLASANLAQTLAGPAPSSGGDTGAHHAAQGATGKKPTPVGTSGQGRMNGPVTQRQARRGGALAPAHATAEGAPGHSGGKAATVVPAAAQAELEALARHLGKGRHITTWEARHIPADVLEMIARDLSDGLSPDAAVNLACNLVLGASEYEWADKAAGQSPKARKPPRGGGTQANQQQQQAQQQAAQARQQALAAQYAARVQQAFAAAAGQAARLIAQWTAGTLTVTAAVLAGMIAALFAKELGKALRALWRKAWQAGRTAAQDAGGGTMTPRAAKEALDAFLATFGTEWTGRISQTRIDDLARELRGLAGLPQDQLLARLAQILGLDFRAPVIARTEVMRAWNAAALDVFRFLGIAYKVWRTHSGHPCPACVKAAASPPLPLAALFPGVNVPAPLAHPNCVVGSTRVAAPNVVVAEDVPHVFARRVVKPAAGGFAASAVAVAERDFGRRNIRAVVDREYVGDVITIRTALGYELTVTPNHPIATRSGWVLAAELAAGGDVLCSIAPEWKVDAVYPDEDHIPPRIEDVAQSLPVTFGAVPTSPEDFHGDGHGTKGEVCVIRANGLLVDGDDGVVVPEHVCEHAFGWGDVGPVDTNTLDALGALDEVFSGSLATPDSGVGGFSVPGAFFGAQLGVSDVLRLADPSGLDMPLQQAPANHRAADAEGFCERLLALSGEITADEIVHVNRDAATTHVYNLDTVEGWYISNGIITHNCQCTVEPALVQGQPVTAVKGLRRQVDLNGEVTWHDEDVPPQNAAGGGSVPPRSHVTTGNGVQQDIPGSTPGISAGGEPPRWDGTQPFPYVRDVEGGDDASQGGPRGPGSRPGRDWPSGYMDEFRGWWPQGGHGTQQAPGMEVGSGFRGRAPNAVGKAATAAKFLKNAPKAKASTVRRQLLENYPPSSLRWLGHMKWSGPVELPLSLVDFEGRDSWAASHQQDKVDEFKHSLAAHEYVSPVVAIIRPGHSKARVIDGHHRLLACEGLGWDVRAYVGHATDPADIAAAEEAHSSQIHQGSDPENR